MTHHPTTSTPKERTQMGHRPLRALALGAATCALLVTSACSGEEEAAPQPAPETSSSTPSESPTETPSETAEPEATPLSRFEDESAVKAARRFAKLYAKMINKNDRDYATVARLLTPFGREQMPAIADEDFGSYFPGPLPFTPTTVKDDGDNTNVVGCFWLDGFALNRKGGIPTGQRTIVPAKMVLTKVDGTWKFVTLSAEDASCKNVSVKGVGA